MKEGNTWWLCSLLPGRSWRDFGISRTGWLPKPGPEWNRAPGCGQGWVSGRPTHRSGRGAGQGWARGRPTHTRPPTHVGHSTSNRTKIGRFAPYHQRFHYKFVSEFLCRPGHYIDVFLHILTTGLLNIGHQIFTKCCIFIFLNDHNFGCTCLIWMK